MSDASTSSNERAIRKAAADLRRAMTFSWHDYDSLKSALDEASRKVRQVIATLELSAVETPSWIAITERLPPLGEYVLIRKPSWQGKPSVIVTRRRDTGYGPPETDFEGIYNIRPTHWMHIPPISAVEPEVLPKCAKPDVHHPACNCLERERLALKASAYCTYCRSPLCKCPTDE